MAYKGCEQAYALTYLMGLPSPSGKAAAKGNVTHKALETLTWRAIKLKAGESEYEDETFGLLKVADITPEWAVKASYEYYKNVESHVNWDDRKDLADCLAWTQKVLKDWRGYYDPMNMDIIEPEVKFDITIREPWAKYSYDGPDGPIEGYLGLKGTVDLVTRDKHDPDIIEIVDYKTGKQQCFATGKPKTYESLKRDPQILLYVYALSKLFPGKRICFSIIFINFDGPFQLFFGPEDIEAAEKMLREMFEEIRDNELPALVEKKMDWKCKYVCGHNKPNPWDESGVSTCQFIHKKIREIGLDEVLKQYGKQGAFNSYGSGGGRQSAQADVD